MASPSSLLISLLLPLLLSTIVSARKAIVDEICKGTSDYILCVDLLNADPRTPDANFPTMADVVVRLALKNARYTHDYLSRIEGTGGGRIGLKRVWLCKMDYEYATNQMLFAYEGEDTENYSSLVGYGKDAAHAVRHCQHVFSKSTWQPLRNRTHVFTSLSEAVASIGKSLGSG
ncbi:Cell wall / vacuolar inhibitor of fructosidase 2 [Linum perenne]